MSFYPTNDRGLLDDRLDRAQALDEAEYPLDWPTAREIALDEFDAREIAQLEAEAEYQRGWRS